MLIAYESELQGHVQHGWRLPLPFLALLPLLPDLSLPRRLPARELKIDRSFVNELENKQDEGWAARAEPAARTSDRGLELASWAGPQI